MRVVFLVESLLLAGAERVVIDLAQAAGEEGCEACVVTLREANTLKGSSYRDMKWLPLFRLGEFRWHESALLAALRLRRMLDRLRPDVVAIHTPKAAVIAAMAGIGIPAVWVLHGHDVCWDGGTARRRLSRGLQRWARRRLGGHVAAVSRSLADHAASGLTMTRGKIAVIPNGVDTKRFRFEERTPTGDVVVCVLGRLIPEKGPEHALEAFGLLKKELPAARLWFVGDGKMREELAAEVAARGWTKAVTFWGMLDRPEERLREATVLWMPSKSEGFGIACVEAMASGVPVLGYDVPGVHDLLMDGCGVLVAPQGSLRLALETAALVRDRNRYGAIARAAKARVDSQYSFERMCAGHYQMMQALCTRESAAAQNDFDHADFRPQGANMEEGRD